MSVHSSIVKSFSQNADPERAFRMQSYMKDHFKFYGIQSPLRKALLKNLNIEINNLEKNELLHQMDALWQEEHRECQYAAGDILIRKKHLLEASDISRIEAYIINKSWWDTVDFLASHLVGQLFRKYPELIKLYLNEWVASEDIWLNRTCIIFQLKYRHKTDFKLLKSCISRLNHKDEFFIQKAIGWALRQYSKSDPESVRAFVETNKMSHLARREASKYI